MAVLPQATKPVKQPIATIGDLCGYVGATVNAGTWQALQVECTRRYNNLWHFDAAATGDGWHITHLHARPGDDRAELEVGKGRG